jgi:hypothetical protein
MAVEAVRQQVVTVAMVLAAQVEQHLAVQPITQVVRVVRDLAAIHPQAVLGPMAAQADQRAALTAVYLLALQVQPPAVVVAGPSLTKTLTTRLSLGPQAEAAVVAVTQPVRSSHQLAQAQERFYRTQSALPVLTQVLAVRVQLVG